MRRTGRQVFGTSRVRGELLSSAKSDPTRLVQPKNLAPYANCQVRKGCLRPLLSFSNFFGRIPGPGGTVDLRQVIYGLHNIAIDSASRGDVWYYAGARIASQIIIRPNGTGRR
jgi:hypothetical protein